MLLVHLISLLYVGVYSIILYKLRYYSINLKLQVKAESIRVYFPRRSLQHLAVKNVSDTIARATSPGVKSPPILGITLPTILLENVAHKPMIQQFLVNVPIVLPESVWNISRDNLPWTLKLKNFSIFTHNGNGVDTKFDILEAVTTNCTLGLNSRQHAEGGPTLGLCIHADMTPLKISLREAQMSLLVDLVEDAAAIAHKIWPELFVAEKSTYIDDVMGSLTGCSLPGGVRSGSPGPPPHLIGTKRLPYPVKDLRLIKKFDIEPKSTAKFYSGGSNTEQVRYSDGP